MLRITCSHRSSTKSQTSHPHHRRSRTIMWSSRSNSSAWSKMAGKSTKTATACRRASPCWNIKWAHRQHHRRPSKSSTARSPPAPFPTWVSIVTKHFSTRRGRPDKINKSPLRSAVFPKAFSFLNLLAHFSTLISTARRCSERTAATVKRKRKKRRRNGENASCRSLTLQVECYADVFMCVRGESRVSTGWQPGLRFSKQNFITFPPERCFPVKTNRGEALFPTYTSALSPPCNFPFTFTFRWCLCEFQLFPSFEPSDIHFSVEIFLFSLSVSPPHRHLPAVRIRRGALSVCVCRSMSWNDWEDEGKKKNRMRCDSVFPEKFRSVSIFLIPFDVSGFSLFLSFRFFLVRN